MSSWVHSIDISLCPSMWYMPCFMYVKTPSCAFNFGLFRRLSAPFHSCVRENRFNALVSVPLCSDPLPCLSTTNNNSKPLTRVGNGRYELPPRQEVGGKVLILLGTNIHTRRVELSYTTYRTHNVFHKSFPAFYGITY